MFLSLFECEKEAQEDSVCMTYDKYIRHYL